MKKVRTEHKDTKKGTTKPKTVLRNNKKATRTEGKEQSG